MMMMTRQGKHNEREQLEDHMVAVISIIAVAALAVPVFFVAAVVAIIVVMAVCTGDKGFLGEVSGGGSSRCRGTGASEGGAGGNEESVAGDHQAA